MDKLTKQGGDANALSTDIHTITAEINAYQRVAGEAIFEIGRRLKHVKENDLAHGEWTEWLTSVGMTQDSARRFVRVYDEFGDSKHVTSRGLGINALYELVQIPEEHREQSHTIPSTGEEKKPEVMTVKELREVKRQLKAEKEAKEQAESMAEEAEARASQYRKSSEIERKRREEAEEKEPEVRYVA